jgi:hypothetical protein
MCGVRVTPPDGLLDGRRIWHGSYYLGYDVEPDCRPEELE